ncbi:MAG: ATP-binding protein [Polyangiaceae bacterium]
MSAEREYEIRPTLEAVARVLGELEAELEQRSMASGPALTDSERIDLAVVLREAIINGVVHGCLEVGGAWQAEDGAEWESEVQRRASTPPYSERRVRVRARYTSETVEYLVRDDGCGFDPASVPNPVDPVWIDQPCGRGLLIVRATVDLVEFNATGNELRMVKRAGSRGD